MISFCPFLLYLITSTWLKILHLVFDHPKVSLHFPSIGPAPIMLAHAGEHERGKAFPRKKKKNCKLWVRKWGVKVCIIVLKLPCRGLIAALLLYSPPRQQWRWLVHANTANANTFFLSFLPSNLWRCVEGQKAKRTWILSYFGCFFVYIFPRYVWIYPIIMV